MVIYITVFPQVVIVMETFFNVILKKNNFNKYYYMKFATDTNINYHVKLSQMLCIQSMFNCVSF